MSLCTPGNAAPRADCFVAGMTRFQVFLAQMDNIRCRWVLDHLCKEAITALEVHAKHHGFSSWQAIFFLNFIIQESIGYLTRDAYFLWVARVTANPEGVSPDDEDQRLPHWNDIWAMHGAAMSLLAVWHHYNRGTEANRIRDRACSPMCEVAPDQFLAVRALYTMVSNWKRSAEGMSHPPPYTALSNRPQAAHCQSAWWPECRGRTPCTLPPRCSRVRNGGPRRHCTYSYQYKVAQVSTRVTYHHRSLI